MVLTYCLARMSSAAREWVKIPYNSLGPVYRERVDGVRGHVERGVRNQVHQLPYAPYIQQGLVEWLWSSLASYTSFSKKARSIVPAQNVKSLAE